MPPNLEARCRLSFSVTTVGGKSTFNMYKFVSFFFYILNLRTQSEEKRHAVQGQRLHQRYAVLQRVPICPNFCFAAMIKTDAILAERRQQKRFILDHTDRVNVRKR